MTGLGLTKGTITAVTAENEDGSYTLAADHVMSSIPLTSWSRACDHHRGQGGGCLTYRNLLTVNLIVDAPDLFPDNWIYVRASTPVAFRTTRTGRRTWFPIVKTSLGLEYFAPATSPCGPWTTMRSLRWPPKSCDEGLVGRSPVLDGCVVRAPRAYPVYNRGYEAHLQTLVDFVKQHPNVHPMGRYGMFKYNNSDHSILTALLSVENILGAKHTVWAVNTETAYHEIRS